MPVFTHHGDTPNRTLTGIQEDCRFRLRKAARTRTMEPLAAEASRYANEHQLASIDPKKTTHCEKTDFATRIVAALRLLPVRQRSHNVGGRN